MEHGENSLQLAREYYLDILYRCKIIARNKRKKRQQDEKYLGNGSFANEIHCSYDEFTAIIVSMLVYHPLRVYAIEYSLQLQQVMQERRVRNGGMINCWDDRINYLIQT